MKFVRPLLCLCLLSLSLGANAQNSKPPFDPKGARKGGLAPPTPIDKMIALDLALGRDGVNWRAVWVKFQLDVGAAELARAKKVRLHAGRNEWPRVFLELGFLQNDVLKTLKKDANVDRRALLIAAGWLQGLHAISNVVADNYNPKTAGLLREPLLVEALLADLEGLKAAKKNTKQAQLLIKDLTEILPMLKIPMRAKLPKQHVQKIAEISSKSSKQLHKLAK